MAMIRFRELALGELEVAVCNMLWDRGEADVRLMHRWLGEPRGIASNTIQSALERLFRKRVLQREKVSNAYVYRPRLTREQFASGVLDHVAGVLGHGNEQPLFSAFLDRVEKIDPGTLDRLEAMIRRRRRRE